MTENQQYIICPKCRREVPEANFTVHSLTCTRHIAATTATTATTATSQRINNAITTSIATEQEHEVPPPSPSIQRFQQPEMEMTSTFAHTRENDISNTTAPASRGVTVVDEQFNNSTLAVSSPYPSSTLESARNSTNHINHNTANTTSSSNAITETMVGSPGGGVIQVNDVVNLIHDVDPVNNTTSSNNNHNRNERMMDVNMVDLEDEEDEEEEEERRRRSSRIRRIRRRRPENRTDAVRSTRLISEIVEMEDGDEQEEVQVLARPNIVTDMTNNNNHNPNENQWSCPQCTLLNSNTQNRCQACDYQNMDIPQTQPLAHNTRGLRQRRQIRPPDPVIRDTLIIPDTNDLNNFGNGYASIPPPPTITTISTPTTINSRPLPPLQSSSFHNLTSSSPTPSSSSSDTAIIGGGALLGGILGGATAYFRGHSVGGGAMEGAFSGAVGGALYSEIRREFQPPSPSIPRSRGGTGGVGMNSSSGGVMGEERVEIIDRGGEFGGVQIRRVTRSSSSGYRSNRTTTTTSTTSANNAHLIRRILQQNQRIANYNHHHHHPLNHLNIDHLSYEELLDMFGDGSDNIRGAPEGTIQSLPSKTIRNVAQEFPKEKRHCCICLEEYKDGDKVRTLPCCHVFHTNCVDRWLKGNASCPVCKNSVLTDR